MDGFRNFLGLNSSGAGLNNAIWIGMDCLLSLKVTYSKCSENQPIPKGHVIFQLLILGAFAVSFREGKLRCF